MNILLFVDTQPIRKERCSAASVWRSMAIWSRDSGKLGFATFDTLVCFMHHLRASQLRWVGKRASENEC